VCSSISWRRVVRVRLVRIRVGALHVWPQRSRQFASHPHPRGCARCWKICVGASRLDALLPGGPTRHPHPRGCVARRRRVSHRSTASSASAWVRLLGHCNQVASQRVIRIRVGASSMLAPLFPDGRASSASAVVRLLLEGPDLHDERAGARFYQPRQLRSMRSWTSPGAVWVLRKRAGPVVGPALLLPPVGCAVRRYAAFWARVRGRPTIMAT